MRILLLNQVFYPDVAATAQHAHDLARHLVKHGHEVQVISSRSIYGEKGATLSKHEVVDGIDVHRVGKSIFGKAGIVARIADFKLFYMAATVKALMLPRADVVVAFTTPPFIALLGWFLRVLRGSKYVYWVMDMYPDVPVACGVMKDDGFVTGVLEGINQFCLRRADRVVVLGRCMLEKVRAKKVDHGQVVHIGVWSDETEVAPVPREANPYRQEWGFGDRFVVMYSGNFGLAHDVDTMLQAAKRLKDDDRIRFAFVGGGKKKSVVDDFVKTHELKNCVTAPYQPREKLGASLSCADLHLVSVLEGLEGCIVPCKLFGAMAAGRGAVYIGNPSSEVARVLMEHDAGVLVRQGDVEGLVKVIADLAANHDRSKALGEHAREALKTVYDREAACEAWRKLLEDVVKTG